MELSMGSTHPKYNRRLWISHMWSGLNGISPLLCGTSSKYTITLFDKKKHFKNLILLFTNYHHLPEFLGSICKLPSGFFRVFEIYHSYWASTHRYQVDNLIGGGIVFLVTWRFLRKLRFYVSCGILRTIWSRVVSFTRYIHSCILVTFVMAKKTSDPPQSPRLKLSSWTNL